MPQRLLRAHVLNSSHHRSRIRNGHCRSIARWRLFRSFYDLRQSEVESLHLTASRDHNVGGFDVSMNDPFRMRFIQSVGYLYADVDDLDGIARATAEHAVKMSSFDVLYNNEGAAVVGLVHFMYYANIGVVESRCEFGFLDKALHPLAVAGDVG